MNCLQLQHLRIHRAISSLTRLVSLYLVPACHHSFTEHYKQQVIPGQFSGHSFHIGATAQHGIPDTSSKQWANGLVLEPTWTQSSMCPKGCCSNRYFVADHCCLTLLGASGIWQFRASCLPSHEPLQSLSIVHTCSLKNLAAWNGGSWQGFGVVTAIGELFYVGVGYQKWSSPRYSRHPIHTKR